MRLLALTGVVLVALVGASSARADITPIDFNPSDDEQFWEIVNEDFDPLSPETQDALDRLPDMTPEERDEYLEKWKEGDAEAKMRSRRWPRLRAFVGSVALSVAASVGLDYALRMEIPGQGFIYKKITGEAYGATPSGLVSVAWRCVGTSPCPVTSVSSGSVTATSGWQLEGDTGSGGFRTACDPLDDAGCAGISNRALELSDIAETALAVAPLSLLSPAATTCGSGVTCALVVRTDDEMEAAMQLEDSDASEYGSHPRPHDAGTYNAPAATTGDKEAAWSHGDTFVTNEYRDYIYIRMNPELDFSGSFSLPQPVPNETYSTYIARLQALGWYGTATTTERGSVHADYGPESPVRVTAPDVGTGTVRILDPIRWPSPAPTVLKSEDITILYNPASAEEVAEGTGTTPITPPPTTIPTAPAVDFTPITDIDFGCKFPYGFLCYAVDFSEQFNVAADAPVFTFDMEMEVALGSFDLGTYAVDLEVMDDWMALWRDILSVVMVVGAIYFVATRMLGFKAGGDPGAAMDDVI